MRRLAALQVVLVVVATALLVGCGSSQGSTVTSTPTSTVPPLRASPQSPGFDAIAAEAALDSAPVGGGIRLETGTGPAYITKVQGGFLGTVDLTGQDPGIHYATAGEAIERCVQGFGSDLTGWSSFGNATVGTVAPATIPITSTTEMDVKALVARVTAAATPILWKELAAGPPTGKILKVVGTIQGDGLDTYIGQIDVAGNPQHKMGFTVIYNPPKDARLRDLPELSMADFHPGKVTLYGEFTQVSGVWDGTHKQWLFVDGFEVAVVE